MTPLAGRPVPAKPWVIPLGIAAAAAPIAVCAFAIPFAIDMPQNYRDLVAGHIGLAGKSKFGDLWALPIAALAAVASVAMFHRIVGALWHAGDYDGATALAEQFLWWSLPAAVGFGSLAARAYTDRWMFVLSAAGVAVMAIATASNAGRARAPPRSIGVALFGVLLVASWPFEIAVLWTRLPDDWTRLSFDPRHLALSLCVIGALAVVATCRLAPRRLGALATTLVVAGSAGLPLLFGLLYHERFAVVGDGFITYPSSAWLPAAVVALAGWAWTDVARRALVAMRRRSSDPVDSLSPIALFALIVAVRYGHTQLPVVSGDDFHFGEKLLGWWSALRFGALPYVDIVPVHGIVEDDLAGYASTLLFDATAATQAESERLVFVALALVSFLALRRATGSVSIATVASVMLAGRLAWLFLTPFFCLAADASLRARPLRWLSLWILAAPVVILGVPSQGLAWIAATSPVALWALVRIVRDRLPVSPPAAVLLGALAALVLATPLRAMLAGAVSYVLAYAPVNEIAYAIPWQASWAGDTRSIARDVVRMSWVVVAMIAMGLVLASFRRSYGRERILAVAVPALLFMILLVPYTMGRIDPAGVSRPGVAANLGWAVLVPLMAVAATPAFAWPAAALAVTIASSSLGVFPSLQTFVELTGLRGVTADIRHADVESIGIGMADAAHLDRVRRIRRVLDRELAPGDTFLDLTDRPALYFYLQRQPPLPIPAPYNLAPVPEQQRAIERLGRETPPIALVSAQNADFDGMRLGLRVPLLFRFVLERYEPFEEDGFVFARLRARQPTTGPPDDKVALFDALSAQSHLYWIPVSWGRSVASLEGKMTRMRSLDSAAGARTRLADDSPQIDFDLSLSSVNPKSAGLLTFDFRCIQGRRDAADAPRLRIYWWGSGQGGPSDESSLYVYAGDGKLIVPLDAYARYLTLPSVAGFRIRLDNPDVCSAADVRNVVLEQRSAVEPVPR